MSTVETRIVRMAEVMRLTGLSKSTIHRRYRAGTFPRPLRLGPQSIGWLREELVEWLESLPRADSATRGGGNNGRTPRRCVRGSRQ